MPWFSQISRLFDFEKGLRETEGSKSLWKSAKPSSRRFFIMKRSWKICQFQDYLTYQSSAILSQSQKIRNLWKFHGTIFLNSESACNWTDFLASIFDRKMDARPFDTIHDIRCLSLAQSLLKRRNTSIWRKREPTHMRLSGTGGLNKMLETILDQPSELFRIHSN